MQDFKCLPPSSLFSKCAPCRQEDEIWEIGPKIIGRRRKGLHPTKDGKVAAALERSQLTGSGGQKAP